MATHETSERRWQSLHVAVSEVGASVAIGMIWLAVMFAAIFGPDIVTVSAGGDQSTVPSAVVLAFFGFLATWVLARRAFPSERK